MDKKNNGKKYLTPEDQEKPVFSTDKSNHHRKAVCDDLGTSIKRDVIIEKEYVEEPNQVFNATGSEREIPYSRRTGNLGGIQYKQSSNVSDAERFNHKNDVEQAISFFAGQREARHGTDMMEDKEDTVISPYERCLHSEVVHNTFTAAGVITSDSSVDSGVESPKRAFYTTGSEREIPYSRRTGNLDGTQYKQNFNVSNAERFSHGNDVELPISQQEARYGTVEHETGDSHIVGGSSYSAIASGTGGVFKTDNRGVFAASVNNSAVEQIKEDLKVSEATAYADKTWSRENSNVKKGAFLTATGIAGRELEAAVGQGGSSGEIDDRAKGQAEKYGYKAGKYAVLGSATFGRGTFRIAKYGKKLADDVKAEVLTDSEAKRLLTGRVKENLIGSGTALAGIIKDGAVHAVEDFRGSDDLGMQAITKPKDVVVGTKRTLRMAKATGNTVQNGFNITKTAVSKIKRVGNSIYSAGKKLISNPVILKGTAFSVIASLVIAMAVSVISSVTGVLTVLSLKSEDYELSKTYLYVTELDARMEEDILNEDTRPHFPPIDEYHYYMNGVEVSKSQMEVYTNADLLLAYLDSKYEDFAFDGIIAGLFGTTVKGEIQSIHEQLHQVEKDRWTEEIVHTSTYTDSDTGQTITSTWIEYVYHMDICLTTKTWEDYYSETKDTLLTEDQQEQYKALQEVGVYTFRQQLASPFVGIDWSVGLTSRWGWRIHPISGELKKHLGLDIAMPGGTPINACNAGTIVTGMDSDGWGNYVKVIMPNGDYTLYGHMSGFAVSNGQTVNSGDVIGYVGTTGASTGNHLHLEYHVDGKDLNPLIFTECEK